MSKITNPVWYRMLYRCSHKVGVNGLNVSCVCVNLFCAVAAKDVLTHLMLLCICISFIIRLALCTWLYVCY